MWQVSALLLEEEGRGEADVVLIKEETPGEEHSRSEEQEDLLISEDGEQSSSVPQFPPHPPTRLSPVSGLRRTSVSDGVVVLAEGQ